MNRRPARFCPPRSAAWLPCLVGLLLATGPAAAEEELAGQEQPKEQQSKQEQSDSSTAAKTELVVPALALSECLEMALHEHPRLVIARASLASAEDASRALDTLRVPECFAPDLPVRRQQAALGITAAAAGVEHVQIEVAYDVARTYFTVLYAREQQQVAHGVVERLTATHSVANDMLQAGARDVTQNDVNRTTVYLRLAEAKELQAAQGIKRALAALREALGKGPEFHFTVPAQRLPVPEVRPNLHELLAVALARRPGLIQAQLFADLTGLEVEAQGTTGHARLETFAAGGDIHSRPVPTGTHDTEYQPAAVGPEMPGLLVGSKGERMQRAHDLHVRAEGVVQETRDLIALEVEDAFLRWEVAGQQAARARDAADTGDRLAAQLRRGFTTGQRVKIEDVVNAHVLASQARSQYNQYLYDEILALADLRLATAGGFHTGLVEALATKKEDGKKEDGKKEDGKSKEK
jgi:outer membrane protein TolC